MTQTRRNFLKFFGGATAGVMLSPLPWKLLDDVSIWTQNWSWIARPPQGPVSWSRTTCTLCPAGCGLRLRLIGDQPVSAWAVPGHPASDGWICPAGFGIAQVRFHPTRLRGAVRRVSGSRDGRRWQRADTGEMVGVVGRKLRRLRETGATDRLALLDLRPGRSQSALYREFLTRMGGGHYLTIPDGRDQAAASLSALVDYPGLVPGYDCTQAATVVSFGAPVLDSWCGAGPARGLLGDDGTAARLIQAESCASASARGAGRWLATRPGTEMALALGLANLILQDGRLDRAVHDRIVDLESSDSQTGYRELVHRFSPERVARVTGCSPSDLRATARRLTGPGGALAVGGGDPGGGPLGHEEETAIWGLNLLLGSVGRGPAPLRADLATILEETPPAAATPLCDLPDHSVELLIVDGMDPSAPLPRGLLRRKLVDEQSLVVGLAAFTAGSVADADIILPTPAPGEWTDDVPGRALAPVATYAVAAPIAPPLPGAHHPADLLDRLASAAGLPAPGRSGARRHADHLAGRVARLHDRGKGEIFVAPDKDPTPVSRLLMADNMAKLLAQGGCWMERSATDPGTGPIRLLGRDGTLAERFHELADGRATTCVSSARPLTLVLQGRQGLVGGAVLPPVVTKLYRESNLMSSIDRVHVNPDTARAYRLRDGHPAEVVTDRGRARVIVVCDEAVMPGVIRAATGPDPQNLGDPDQDQPTVISICDTAASPVWRIMSAALLEVRHG